MFVFFFSPPPPPPPPPPVSQVIAYFIHIMESVVTKDYVIVYLHAQSLAENQPDSAFFKQLYNMVDPRSERSLCLCNSSEPDFISQKSIAPSPWILYLLISSMFCLLLKCHCVHNLTSGQLSFYLWEKVVVGYL